MVVHYHNLPQSIMSNLGSFFTLKFWLLLCYFLEIKQKLSTSFYSQINGQTKKQNSIMETYLQDFIYFKQDD